MRESLIALLIRLFPRDFRERYAADMRDLLRDQLDAARRGPAAFGAARVWMSTLAGLPGAAFRAHRDALFPQLTSVDRTRRSLGLEQTMNDLRFAVRLLRKSPVFAVVAILAISLGAGAVTTIFSAMNAMVLRPVPGVADGSRVVGLEFRRRDGKDELTGMYPTYAFLRDHSHTTSGVAAWARATLSIAATGRDAARVVKGSYTSGNYFSVLGVRPALGRFFLPDEDRTPLANPVIVVSYDFWATTLGADSSAIGKPLSVNGNPYTLIGVAPEGFRGLITLLPLDGWIPIMMQGQIQPERKLESATWLRMFARLRDGGTAEAATAELSTLFTEQNQAPSANRANRVVSIHVSPLRAVPEDARKMFLGFMAILFVAATFVLFIASVDVAAMLSARAVARRREMAVRAALGASRARLITQLLTEILVLFGIGAAGAIAIAYGATTWATRFPLPAEIIVPPDLVPDGRVMAFALLVSLATGVVFGLTPALRASRDDVSARLRDGTTGAGMRRSRIGNALIVGQLALSLVLLVAAGLFVRALGRAASVPPGFERSGVTVVSFDTRTWGYNDVAGQRFYHALRDRVAALPGVTAVTFASFAPLTTRSLNDSVTYASGERAFTWYVAAGNDYFRTLEMPVIAGRALGADDNERAAPVAVVNETFAKRLAPNGGALGRTFMRGKQAVTVVGVARDAKYATFDEATPSMMFLPIDQVWQPTQTMMVRGLSPAQLARGLHDAMRAIDSKLPVPSLMTLDEASGINVLPQRIALIVTGVLGGVGLLLSTLGLYGVIAYSVNQRTRELGVRLALGAQRATLLGMVLADGLRLAAVGVVVGLAAAAGATRVIAEFLFDVSALDAVTFIGTALLLVIVALLATYVPARRAARLDPMSALRSE
jgi:putative ABC transport system permease protein